MTCGSGGSARQAERYYAGRSRALGAMVVPASVCGILRICHTWPCATPADEAVRLYMQTGVCRPYVAVKITDIGANVIEAPGTQLCIVLRQPCATLDELCFGEPCTYAIFNDPFDAVNKCCPVRTWSAE